MIIIVKGGEEMFGGDRDVNGIDCVDGFKDTYLSPNSSSCVVHVQHVTHTLIKWLREITVSPLDNLSCWNLRAGRELEEER